MSFNSIKVNNSDTNYTHSIFDISEYTGRQYDNLSSALTDVPTGKQSGGMTVEFIQHIPATYTVIKTEDITEQPTGTEVQEELLLVTGTYNANEIEAAGVETPASSATYYLALTVDETTTYTTWEITKATSETNKYVQYRLMSDTFNTTVTNWQGVDEEPTAGSDNLVKSGSVERRYINHNQEYTQEQKKIARTNIGLSNIKELENVDTNDIKVVDDENNRDLVHIHRTDNTIGNSFVITDDNDNEICRADKNGFHVPLLHYGVNDTNIEDTITNLEERIDGNVSNNVVLIMFMGQSNMAGRGVTSAAHPQDAPQVMEKAGYEFRAISDPTKLYPITKTFGNTEDKSGGIDDKGRKTGGCVPAFVNSFYKTTKTTVIGVSASRGGSSITAWQPGTAYLTDAINRLRSAISFLEDGGYNIVAKYVLWCQGEADGDDSMDVTVYGNYFDTMSNALFAEGIEKMFMMRIGKYNGTDTSITYDNIILEQNDICKNNADYIMATTVLASFKDKGLMKDQFHYFQEGYNIAGTFSGLHIGNYLLYGKSDTMYDVMTDELYFDNKTY